jgi:hypothetical protein
MVERDNRCSKRCDKENATFVTLVGLGFLLAILRGVVCCRKASTLRSRMGLSVDHWGLVHVLELNVVFSAHCASDLLNRFTHDHTA